MRLVVAVDFDDGDISRAFRGELVVRVNCTTAGAGCCGGAALPGQLDLGGGLARAAWRPRRRRELRRRDDSR